MCVRGSVAGCFLASWMIFVATQAARGESAGVVAWRLETDGTRMGVLTAPAVSGDRVYVGEEWGTLFCLDRWTGRVLWERQVGRTLFTPPVLEGDGILTLPTDGVVRRWGASGDLEWEYSLPREFHAQPFFRGDQGFACDFRGMILSFDGRRGHEIWRTRSSGRQPFAIDAKLMYVFDEQHESKTVFLLDLANGEERLAISLDKYCCRPVDATANSDGVIATTYHLEAFAIDRIRGSLAWFARFEEPPFRPLAPAPAPAEPEARFVAAGESRFVCFDVATGAACWSVELGGGPDVAVSRVGEDFALWNPRWLAHVDGRTGAIQWRRDMDPADRGVQPRGLAGASDGMIYACDNGSSLVAYGLTPRDPEVQEALAALVADPPADSRGHLEGRIADLDSSDFETRERATESFAGGPRADLGYLVRQARTAGIEVEKRLGEILDAHGEFGRKLLLLLERQRHRDPKFLEEAARHAPPELARLLGRR